MTNPFDKHLKNRQLPEVDKRHIEILFSDINGWLDSGSPIADNFDDTFIRDLETQFKNTGYLSDKQVLALENICDNWVDI